MITVKMKMTNVRLKPISEEKKNADNFTLDLKLKENLEKKNARLL